MQIWELGVSEIVLFLSTFYFLCFKYEIFEKLEKSIKALTVQGILVDYF